MKLNNSQTTIPSSNRNQVERFPKPAEQLAPEEDPGPQKFEEGEKALPNGDQLHHFHLLPVLGPLLQHPRRQQVVLPRINSENGMLLV